ncbi:hypothetical protein BU23DRAFT_90721 [Bimuria novae-zelandiae CBS 107.79]|uniref:Uncharacterized protein n=1 Tax=Bimuria novae-zelandiae CBS 107.79 TaxID=1447943 RepID=A0A6A5VI77_9PLEO|nr:hypothetical protein BU23DRAFT_90721 [Bimuria novae-zelandiae CBS 107.79]
MRAIVQRPSFNTATYTGRCLSCRGAHRLISTRRDSVHYTKRTDPQLRKNQTAKIRPRKSDAEITPQKSNRKKQTAEIRPQNQTHPSHPQPLRVHLHPPLLRINLRLAPLIHPLLVLIHRPHPPRRRRPMLMDPCIVPIALRNFLHFLAHHMHEDE